MTSADRAEIDAVTGEDCVTLAKASGLGGAGGFRSLECTADSSEFVGSARICQETEVADATEAFRKDVKEKTADELVGIEHDHLGFVAGTIVLPAEADAIILAGEQAVVCDCDAMGIAPQIVEDLLWPCEWAFGVDDPVEVAERLQIASERGGFEEPDEMPEEAQVASIERCLKAFKEQPAVESRQNMDWEEEIGTATNPASVERETSAGDDEVSMWVMSQGLTPGVQNADHPGLSAKVLEIRANDTDRFCRRLEKDIVDDSLVLECHGADGGWHCEHDMEIRHRQQIGFAIGEPLGTRQALALWAVSVTATGVGDAEQAAVIAPLDMAAKSGGTAHLDGGHNAALLHCEPSSLRGAECIAVAAEDVRHL